MIRRSIFRAALVCSLLPAVALPPCWGLKSGEHIEVEQQAQRFGSVKVFFDNRSLKMVFKSAVNGHHQDLLLISKAPTWGVCIFNNQLKLKYSSSVDGIADESQLDFGHLQPIMLKPCAERDTVFMRQQAKLLLGKPKDANVNKGENFLPGGLNNQSAPVKIEKLEYTLLQEHIPAGLSHVVQALYNVPKEDRYPLSFVQVTARGTDKLMTTSSVCKKPGNVVLPAEPNYRTCDNLLEVKYGKQQDSVKDIGLQLLDGGSR